jgi:DNA-binding LacI/PurR family transcriptional regulator
VAYQWYKAKGYHRKLRKYAQPTKTVREFDRTMPVTAKDIARELSLSQPTVSRILNGDPKHRVSPATRERVMEAAKRLGYQPNAVARSLRRGRTDVIGLYSNHNYDARNDFWGTIIGALQRNCEERHIDLLLHSALYGRPPDEMFAKLRDGRVDGLLLHATSGDPLVEMVGNSSLPVVAIADPDPRIPSVSVDDLDGMRQSIEYLWARGHRRYVYICPEVSLSSIERRRAAFEADLQKRGLAEKDRVVLRINWELVGGWVSYLLASGLRTAVLCWNDRTAYRLLDACLDRNVPIPGQIAIVGFDGFPTDRVPRRRLVTVYCPWETVASQALVMLLGIIEGKGQPEQGPREICLPVTRVEGDTA